MHLFLQLNSLVANAETNIKGEIIGYVKSVLQVQNKERLKSDLNRYRLIGFNWRTWYNFLERKFKKKYKMAFKPIPWQTGNFPLVKRMTKKGPG